MSALSAPFASLQQAMGQVLLHLPGHEVLGSDEAWEAYLATDAGKIFQGVPRESLYLYEELLYYSVEDTLSSLFPHAQKFLTAHWHSWVEKFRRTYPNSSFQLYRSAEKFPLFISQQPELMERFPFLLDLATYEWLEIDVLNDPDPVSKEDSFELGFPQSPEHFEDWSPVVNTARRIQSFQYNIPAFLESLKDMEEDEILAIRGLPSSPSDILIYRDSENFQARFFQLTPLTTQLLLNLHGDLSYKDAFVALQKNTPALQKMALSALMAQGLGLLNQCFASNILLGSRPYS
jgi:hypothetical protein